ncbi:cutinase family protein [Rhodococcus sp. ACT016]|uniref:cutinase family protein n=1 Tax=Rhodococcus sp. ACT016 TaxID=3134808 RepID=UPI003D2C5092
MNPLRRGASIAAVTTVAVLAATSTGAAAAAAQSTTTAAAESSNCAPLHLVIANGTTQSSEHAAPDQDGGFGSGIAIPAMLAANSGSKNPLLERTYISYSASFGGKPGDQSKATYEKSVAQGITNTKSELARIAKECPSQKVFLTGHSQGGQVMSALAREIGAGRGPIPADRVAGVALFSDPTRTVGSPIFGSTSQTSPAAVPGSKGTEVAKVQIAAIEAPDGGGIAPNTASTDSFGSLRSRTASFCAAGDVSCDTPADAPLARMVANIGGQSILDPQDPVGIVTTIGTALGQSVLYTGASVVNDNIDFNSASGTFQVKQSKSTVLGRMVRYSDPKNQKEGVGESITALTKIAGMGIGAAVTTAKDLLSPASIVQIAAAGVAGPQAALAVLGARFAQAAVKLVPPVTIENTVKLAFNEIQRDVTDNKGLFRMAVDTSYWQTVEKHGGSYETAPTGTTGESAVELTKNWVVAAAQDIAGSKSSSSTTAATTAPKSVPVYAPRSQQPLSASTILASNSTGATSTATSTTTTTAEPTAATTATTPSTTETTVAVQPGLN